MPVGAVSHLELLGTVPLASAWKRKGKSSRTRVSLATALDKSAAQARESRRTFFEVVLSGLVDQELVKSETDEVLKKIQAAESLQSQIAKARMAANALGDDASFAKQVAALQSKIARLEERVAGCNTAGNSSHRVEQKVALRGQEDQHAGTSAEGRGNGPSCAHRS